MSPNDVTMRTPMPMPRTTLIVSFFLLCWAGMASAQLDIVIESGRESATPIAIVPYAWDGEGEQPELDVIDIVRSDLYRSGQFKPLAEANVIETPSTLADIRFATWRLLQADYLVIGRIEDRRPEGFLFYTAIVDVNSEQPVGQPFQVLVRPGDSRRIAHFIADQIYEAILGIPGAFSTRIAYVTLTGEGANREYKLVVADADGFAPQSIVTSKEPLLSPSWSPDGGTLAYVSFERGNSSIWVQEVATGARELKASFKGINGAPDFSPDGRRMAVTLSRSGSPEINVMDLATGQFTQLTRHWAIDTEPAWMPDGNSIVFTSDRGGKPQLYQIDADGGDPSRVTFKGDYNARATISPDGRLIAMAQGGGNVYRIAVMKRDNGEVRVVSPGPLDESPSFAPNGSMILYATREGGRGVLSAVSVDGRVRQRLALTEGDVREPAWSPFRN